MSPRQPPLEPSSVVLNTTTITADAPPDPPGRWRALALMMVSMVCCLSPWFGATAAMAELKLIWGIDDVTASLLTVMVQFGFLVGACTSAFLGIADVVPPRRLFCAGGLAAAVVNALLLIPSLSFGVACVLRFSTGVAMAYIYPPGMKAAATWFKRGRGLGLGAMVGALCIGSALPYVIVGAQWQTVIIATSAACAAGAVLILLGADGPFPFKGASRFECGLICRVLRSPGTMLSIGAYSMHMWELYACWSWFRSFAAASLVSYHGFGEAEAKVSAGTITFFVVASGAAGCLVGGLCGDRLGRCKTCAAMCAVSFTCALVAGHMASAPVWLLVAVGLLWGVAVVGDSAQYSAMVTEVTDADLVGTALTLQQAIGYTITCATVFLIPVWEAAVGWGWAFAFLSPPNLLAIAALWRLYTHPAAYKARMASGLG